LVVTEQTQLAPDNSLRELRRALDVLAEWQKRPWRDVCRIVSDVSPLVWNEMQRCGVWDDIPEREQAALYWALADGRCLSQAPQSFINPRHHDVKITSLCRDLAHFAVLCTDDAEMWPDADRA
jgi:hypothetical protein